MSLLLFLETEVAISPAVPKPQQKMATKMIKASYVNLIDRELSGYETLKLWNYRNIQEKEKSGRLPRREWHINLEKLQEKEKEHLEKWQKKEAKEGNLESALRRMSGKLQEEEREHMEKWQEEEAEAGNRESALGRMSRNLQGKEREHPEKEAKEGKLESALKRMSLQGKEREHPEKWQEVRAGYRESALKRMSKKYESQ